jgi:hypothetical protein
MDREKLKLIVRNLELLTDSLKAEIYSDASVYSESDRNSPLIADYDELYTDDDD